MKICLIGNFSKRSDEGLRKLSRIYYNKLSIENEILAFHTKDFLNPYNILTFLSFKANIIQHICGPSIRGLLLLKLLKLISLSKPKTFLLASRPLIGNRFRLLSLLKPDFFLTQSKAFEEIAQHTGCRTIFFSKWRRMRRILSNHLESKGFLPEKKLI